IFKNGSFRTYHGLENGWSGSGLYSNYHQGDAKAEIGQKFVYEFDLTSNSNNDIKDEIYDANTLLKFDGNAFNITEIDGQTYYVGQKSTNSFYSSTMKFKMLYAAKKRRN